MIVNHSEYNADNKVFCRYKNRDIAMFGNDLKHLEASLRQWGHDITIFEWYDFNSEMMNNLEISEVREFECNNSPTFVLTKKESWKN